MSQNISESKSKRDPSELSGVCVCVCGGSQQLTCRHSVWSCGSTQIPERTSQVPHRDGLIICVCACACALKDPPSPPAPQVEGLSIL